MVSYDLTRNWLMTKTGLLDPSSLTWMPKMNAINSHRQAENGYVGGICSFWNGVHDSISSLWFPENKATATGFRTRGDPSLSSCSRLRCEGRNWVFCRLCYPSLLDDTCLPDYLTHISRWLHRKGPWLFTKAFGLISWELDPMLSSLSSSSRIWSLWLQSLGWPWNFSLF